MLTVEVIKSFHSVCLPVKDNDPFKPLLETTT